MIANKKAARLGSEGGERFNRLTYFSTACATAQHLGISTYIASVVQFLHSAVDGATTELYLPVRARRREKSAKRGGGRAGR